MLATTPSQCMMTRPGWRRWWRWRGTSSPAHSPPPHSLPHHQWHQVRLLPGGHRHQRHQHQRHHHHHPSLSYHQWHLVRLLPGGQESMPWMCKDIEPGIGFWLAKPGIGRQRWEHVNLSVPIFTFHFCRDPSSERFQSWDFYAGLLITYFLGHSHRRAVFWRRRQVSFSSALQSPPLWHLHIAWCENCL